MLPIHMIDDFDLTLTRFHTNGRYRKLSESDLVSAYLLREKVLACHYGPHYYSIGTHGESREMIWETLLKVCNLSEEEASSVAIINLNERECSDKSIHIRRGLETHRIPLIPGKKGPLYARYAALTVITDDTTSNMEFAANEGAVIIRVNCDTDIDNMHPLDDEHLKTGLKILKQPNLARELADEHNIRMGAEPNLKETARIFIR